MTWKIPLFKIYWDEKDIEMVNEAIRRGMFWAAGPNIEKLEHMIADYIGVKHAVVFNSGTSALHAVLSAYGIGNGDEVIVPSFTFIATSNAPVFVGARPVFADIEDMTYGIDPEDIRNKITPNTKAIIPVHYGGSPCMIQQIRQIADENNLILIEDAAESIGADVDGKKVGHFGDAAILSFCSNKVITTGEGGAVVTDSKDIFNKLILLRSHGREENTDYFSSTKIMDYVTLGYNLRMSDITAALGLSQLDKLNRNIEMRQNHARTYIKKLSSVSEIEINQLPVNFTHVYQMFTIRIKDGSKSRDELSDYLAQKGIMTKIYFSPVHLTHYYKNILGYNCSLPVTEKLSQQVLTLPMYPELTESEIEYIVQEISTFFS